MSSRRGWCVTSWSTWTVLSATPERSCTKRPARDRVTGGRESVPRPDPQSVRSRLSWPRSPGARGAGWRVTPRSVRPTFRGQPLPTPSLAGRGLYVTPPAGGAVSSASPPDRRAAAPVPPPGTRGCPLPGASAPSIDGASPDTPGSRSSGGALPKRPVDTTADTTCTVAAVFSRLSCPRVSAKSSTPSAARPEAKSPGFGHAPHRVTRSGRPAEHPRKRQTTTVSPRPAPWIHAAAVERRTALSTGSDSRPSLDPFYTAAEGRGRSMSRRTCRGRTGAPCERYHPSVSPARPPNRTCDSHLILCWRQHKMVYVASPLML